MKKKIPVKDKTEGGRIKVTYGMGQTVEMAHGKWKERYMITYVDVFNTMKLMRCKLPVSKADERRFPVNMEFRSVL